MTIALIIGFILIVILIAKKQKYDETSRLITGRMFQMLESFKIIDSTVKLDIFTQRLNLLRDLAKDMPKNENLKQYAGVALKTYARKYPQVFITETYRQILEQPQLACSDKFRDEAATAFYIRTCNRLKEDIATLKTTAAKQRRVNQAEEWAELVTEMLRSYNKQQYADTIRETCANVLSTSTPRPI